MPIAEDPDLPPSTEPGRDPFTDLVLDEEFVRSASVREGSGRSRMLAAKWRREPPEPQQPWRPPTEARRRRFGRRPKAVDPWGNSRPTRRNWQAPLYVVLTGAVVLAGLNVDRLHDWYTGRFGGGPDGSGVAAPVVTQAPETAAPTAAPPSQAPQDPTVDHPWAGSPADAWPAGPDAVVLPAAQATGVFSGQQVAAQLQLVKNYLVESNLDPKVVAGGDPAPVLALLNGQEHDQLSQALAHPDKDHDPTNWISRFNPATAVPVGPDVKLQGRITFEGDGDHGVLVHSDYTFVYALTPGPQQYTPPAPPGGGASARSASLTLAGSTPVTREIVRRVQDFRFYDPGSYDVDRGKLYVENAQSSMGGNYCETGDGWLEPEFPQYDFDLNGDDTASPDAGPTVDPYDRSKPLPDDGRCDTESRT
ncbi:hypothetical protein ACIGXM_01790 [Kitasatospora sp. NPDC052896]|uniref:SCO2583/SCO2584 N-terminal domain-containing protein n=1 Tax=Kitasatospora sp. NPDC052896 TaxID=3364061 RepID=UPI0037CC21FE